MGNLSGIIGGIVFSIDCGIEMLYWYCEDCCLFFVCSGWNCVICGGYCWNWYINYYDGNFVSNVFVFNFVYCDFVVCVVVDLCYGIFVVIFWVYSMVINFKC